jgi:FkbM family methyltransferase
MYKIFNGIKSIFQAFSIGITRYSTLEKLRQNSRAANDIELLLTLPNENASQLLKYLKKSKSQLRQDLFVLSELNFKNKGYFVEFGATNGIDFSNSHLLEKEFGWAGILAEPARCWHKKLKENRSANIDINCVWKESESTLMFNEVFRAELSTINKFSTSDSHKELRKSGMKYDVTTISLNDLLSKFNAPTHIDYLSIDTEGSEYVILSNFDFTKHSFSIITCEHNFSTNREQIYSLLTKHGYIRKYQNLSKFDDWYVKSSELSAS